MCRLLLHAINVFIILRVFRYSISAWELFVNTSISNWVIFHRYWLLQYHRPLLIIQYEDMKENLEAELHRMCDFLEVPLLYNVSSCVVSNAEGPYRRQKTKEMIHLPYTDRVKMMVDQAIQTVRLMLE